MSYAATTLRTYMSAVNKFVTFCLLHSLLVLDHSQPFGTPGSALLPTVTPTLLCFYMAWLPLNNVERYSSIMLYITALAQWCKARGRPDPRHDPRTQRTHIGFFAVCRGLKRELGAPRPTRYPVTMWHMGVLIKAAGQLLPPRQAANIKAATLLAFGAMTRVGEITTPGQTLDPTRHALRSDIEFVPAFGQPKFMRFHIKVSKCDQFRETCTVTVAAAADPSRCPVRAMHRLFQCDPQPQDAPLFNFNKDSDPRRETPGAARVDKFRKLCSDLFEFAGVQDMGHLRTHSFRQGGATALLAAGAPTWVIKVMGRWKSDAWHAYACVDVDQLRIWSTRMFMGSAEPVDYAAHPPQRIMDYC